MDDKYEDRKKDEIIQIIYDLCEEINWGDSPGRETIVKFTFDGKFILYPPDIRHKPKIRKPLV